LEEVESRSSEAMAGALSEAASEKAAAVAAAEELTIVPSSDGAVDDGGLGEMMQFQASRIVALEKEKAVLQTQNFELLQRVSYAEPEPEADQFSSAAPHLHRNVSKLHLIRWRS